MIIKLQSKEVKNEECDVDFPIYSRDSIGDNWRIFKRIEYSGKKHLGRDEFIDQFKATIIQITTADTDEELEEKKRNKYSRY